MSQSTPKSTIRKSIFTYTVLTDTRLDIIFQEEIFKKKIIIEIKPVDFHFRECGVDVLFLISPANRYK